MKFLGIDYGSKRIGLAKSDELGMMAFPFQTIRNSPTVVNEIKKICEQENISQIVLGQSLSEKNIENEIQKDIDIFKTKLEKEISLKVHYENEVYSSHEGQRFNANKSESDSPAATIILQRFLEKIHKL